MVSRRRHEDPCIEAEYVTPESELMWAICEANCNDCDADELDDVESMILDYRAEIEAAARANAMRELLDATAEWTGALGRGYRVDLEAIVKRLLAPKDPSHA